MIKVGIDTLSLYTPRYALDLATLAKAREIDPDKYHIGLGQIRMSVIPPDEDIVTMAANAATKALMRVDPDAIEILLFATESGIDQSKAAGLYVHDLLGLPSRCRVIELKQACYSGTAGLQLVLPFLRENPNKKVLLIASDVARYGLNTPGESSQGAGAVAMVLSAYPRLLAFEPETGLMAESAMDFWRPNYRKEALVEGKYSSKLYLSMLEKTWQQYHHLSNRSFKDHAYFCYHTPVPRLVEKAHHYLLKLNAENGDGKDQIANTLIYGRQMGNSYTASLYVSLAALLDLTKKDLSSQRIGFYSYGSGCMAEFFSGVVQPGYRTMLEPSYHEQLLSSREQLTYHDYAAFYQFQLTEEGDEQVIPVHTKGLFRLAKLQQHKRIYEKSASVTSPLFYPKLDVIDTSSILKVTAPGKLILSGEHAVIYGQPALAMAVNRYVSATISHEVKPQVLFDLANLAHQSRLTFAGLKLLKQRIKAKYHRFMRGEYRISDVLQKPFELAQFALGVFAESFNLSLPHGFKIEVQSDIPMGCGMGSSAATILSVMHAIAKFLNVSISSEMLFELALEVEHMQHGRSSGLDLKVASLGGCVLVEEDAMYPRPLPMQPMFLVNTGAPSSSTGQCVETVKPWFASSSLKEEFGAITRAMDAALQLNSPQQIKASIRHNQQLLHRIGVVPAVVHRFIEQVEVMEGAAKICGAGSVSGDRAGVVLVFADDKERLTQLCAHHQYQLMPVVGEARGVCAA